MIEADQFFYHGPFYHFNPEQLVEAHNWCLSLTKEMLSDRIPVVVANTFTRFWEIQPYLDLGPTRIIRLTTQFDNIHGVHAEQVARQRDRMENLASEEFV